MLKYLQNIMLWMILLLIVIVPIVCMDFLLGYWEDTTVIRRDSKQFRGEADFLGFTTKSMLPNIKNVYSEQFRDEGERLLPYTAPRILQTDANGTILGDENFSKCSVKVLFLGGSTTECNEVDEPFRFPYYSSQLLQKNNVMVCAVNGGVRGHTTQDSINSLLNHPEYKNADIYVLMHNINDRLNLTAGIGYNAMLPHSQRGTGSSVTNSFIYFIDSLVDYLAYNSNIAFLLRFKLMKVNPFSGEREPSTSLLEESVKISPELLQNACSSYEQNLRIFLQITKVLDKKVVLMTQPLGEKSQEQDAFNEVIRAVAYKNNIPLVDLAANITKDDSWAFLSDGIHYSNLGSIKIAEFVHQEIEKMLATTQALAKNNIPDKQAWEIAHAKQYFPYAGRYPSFSKDGTKLVYQHTQDKMTQIFIYNQKTGQNTTLAIATQRSARHPVFLDENRIIYAESNGQESEFFEKLMVYDLKKQKSVPLYSQKDIFGSIPSSSYNNTVHFAGVHGKSSPDIYSLNLESKKIEQVTHTPFEEWRPVASRDGTLYFIAYSDRNFDIYKKEQGKNVELEFTSPADEWDPAISPDGKWLVFASKKSGNWDLYMKRVGEDILYQLTTAPTDEWDPSFHPNGKEIVFASSNGRESYIYSMEIDR